MVKVPVAVSLITLAFSARAAKTDLAGCSLTVVPLLTEIVTTTAANGVVGSFGNYAFTTFQWDGTEQCQLIDCGGGRAPPKSNQPGCPLYTGTDTVPSLPFPTASLTLNQAAAATTTAAPALASPPAVGTTALPAPVSSPLASATGAPAIPSAAPPAPAASNPASATVAPTVTESGSASQVSDLNPTVSANDAIWARGGWGIALPGLIAVAMVSLHAL